MQISLKGAIILKHLKSVGMVMNMRLQILPACLMPLALLCNDIKTDSPLYLTVKVPLSVLAQIKTEEKADTRIPENQEEKKWTH